MTARQAGLRQQWLPPQQRLATLLLLLCCTPATALADAAGRDVADLDLEDLVRVHVSPFDVSTQDDSGYRAGNAVTGSRVDVPINELPFAVQAFTEAFIDDQMPRDVFDVARYAPGVTYRSNDFNEGSANLAIRGFAVASTPGAVQILRDGFHGPSLVDFTGIARLEVIKGPASFLYGQVAPGGIVNLISKAPQPRSAGRADVRYGSYDQVQANVDLTGPLSPRLLYRFSATADRDIRYWQPYDGSHQAVTTSLQWLPAEAVSIGVRHQFYRKDEAPLLMQKPGYAAQRGVVPTAVDPNLSGVDVPGLADTWNTAALADYRHSEANQVSAWADIVPSAHWHLRLAWSRLHYDVDAMWTGNLGMANNTTLLQGRRVRAQTYENTDSSYEIQAVGRYQLAGHSLRLLLGVQQIERRFDNWAAQAPNDPSLGNDPIASPLPLWDLANPATWNRLTAIPRAALTDNRTDQRTDYTDRSLYAGGTLGLLNDRLLLLAGLRRTITESRTDDRIAAILRPTIESAATTPQAGALFQLTPSTSLFACYAESFVPPTALLRNTDGSQTIPRPSEGRGWDIGVKGAWLERRLSGTVTFFDIRNRNIINDLAFTDSDGVVRVYNVQSGEQRSSGYEADLTVMPAEHWQAYLSYSRMRARITEFSGRDDVILAQDPALLTGAARDNYRNALRLHNAPLQMSAPHLFSAWLRHDFSVGGTAGWHVAGGVNHVRDQTLLPDSPASARQTYTLVNLLVGRTWQAGRQKISLDLMGKNLGDARYRPSQSTRSRPREFLLNLRTEF
jgi:iron complex outermembrane receptor protein